MTDVPVKAISDIEVKAEVSADDKILILDSVSEEARLASKSELKWDKWDPWDDGAPWADGAAATVTVGSTTTGSAGTSASVTNSGTSSAAVLNFVIPKWADGSDGSDWAAASVTVGTTTTLPAWSSATVTNSGTSSAAVLNFGIPKWDSGEGSGDVIWPNSSTDGGVVLFDGTTGKAIKDSGVKLGTAASKDTGTSSGNIPVLDSTGKLSTSVVPDVHTDAVTSVNGSTWAVVLDADDISDSTTTNKFVTASDKTTWGNKQDALTLPATPTQWNLVTRWANNKSLVDWGAIPTWVPSGWTDGQVLSKVSGSVAWANPSWWDVMVSSQTGNILTTWMKIRAWTETDYGNLGTRDQNTLYLTIE